MSSRYASEQLATLRHDSQRLVEEAENQEDHALAIVAIEDVNVASRSPARLLITASTPQAVETLARRIHGIGPRAQFPFVMTCAGELPIGAPARLKSGSLKSSVEMHLKDISTATRPL